MTASEPPIASPLTPRPARRALLAWGAMLLLLSLVAGYVCTTLFLAANVSAGWPTTVGVVQEAEVVAVSRGMSARYRPQVRYRYVVEGREYEGTQISRSDAEGSRSADAMRQLQGIAPGQEVRVSYDPANPARSLLRPGAGAAQYAMLALPVLLLATGVAMLVVRRRLGR